MTSTTDITAVQLEQTDPETLIPHRAPMRLIDQVLAVSAHHASALANINENHLFFIPGNGVPAWTGLEMMGQTAALMAGFQQQQGLIEVHTGFLLACRQYQCQVAWFSAGQQLRIDCDESALVGDNLANFSCAISLQHNDEASNTPLASAQLSVFRQTNPTATEKDQAAPGTPST